jgi:hypothetical protein
MALEGSAKIAMITSTAEPLRMEAINLFVDILLVVQSSIIDQINNEKLSDVVDSKLPSLFAKELEIERDSFS